MALSRKCPSLQVEVWQLLFWAFFTKWNISESSACGKWVAEFTSSNSPPYSTHSTQQSIFRQFYGSSVNLPLELGLTNIRRGCGTDGTEGRSKCGGERGGEHRRNVDRWRRINAFWAGKTNTVRIITCLTSQFAYLSESGILSCQMNLRLTLLAILLCTLWLTRRLERLRVSASGRARGTRNSSKRFLRHNFK